MKTLLFDFDWTIGNSFDILIDCVKELSKKYWYQVGWSFEEIREKSLKKILKEECKLKRYSLPFYIRDIKNLLKTKSLEIPLYPKIKEALEELSKKHSLHIISSNKKEIIEEILKKNQISCFQNIYSDASLFGKHKSIKRFLKKFGIKKENIIYIWDEIRDIEACKKIGVSIIAVTRGFNNKQILEKYNPEYIINSPEELLTIIKSL